MYEALAGTGGFKRLLHECPLYLFKRSLLLDEPDTYKNAVELYAARNKTAHGDSAAPTYGRFSPSAESAVCALDTAIDVIRWLGLDADYTVFRGMERVEGAVS